MYVSDSKLTPKWLYKSLLDQLGLEAGFYRGDAKKLLQKQIEIIREKEHRKVVCILDEAHLLEKETLEEFRFLLNSNYDSESQLALILAGQTELWDSKLRFRKYAAIRQRIDINCVLPHLDRSETEEYIESHLRYAGCNQTLFTEKALDEIHRSSTGIPRVINRTCDKWDHDSISKSKGCEAKGYAWVLGKYRKEHSKGDGHGHTKEEYSSEEEDERDEKEVDNKPFHFSK